MSLPPIHLLDLAESTNDLAMQAARQGAPHASCWIADQQLAGRGRRETSGERRSWHSPPHTNLYLSLLLRGPFEPALGTTLTLAAAVATHATLSAFTHDPNLLWIKWPNDLYIHDQKCAGILSEGILAGSQLDAVVIGIGINVNLTQEHLPPHLQPIATSLHIATGRTFDRLAIALQLRQELLTHADLLLHRGLTPIIDLWRPHDRSVGRRVELLVNQQWTPATSQGIAQDGSLKVLFDDGRSLRVQAGEVRFISSHSKP